jgi:hypothetical protein
MRTAPATWCGCGPASTLSNGGQNNVEGAAHSASHAVRLLSLRVLQSKQLMRTTTHNLCGCYGQYLACQYPE